MEASVRTLKLTYEDYLYFPEDGRRHELIDGEHYVTAAPNIKHQTTVSRLHLSLGGFVQDWKAGRSLAGPHGRGALRL